MADSARCHIVESWLHGPFAVHVGLSVTGEDNHEAVCDLVVRIDDPDMELALAVGEMPDRNEAHEHFHDHGGARHVHTHRHNGSSRAFIDHPHSSNLELPAHRVMVPPAAEE